MAIRVVRRTGCHYTGITLSQQQLDFAQNLVNEAILQERITFQLADYRKVKDHHKFDRIISCEMVEHVGHEYLAEWFKRCDHLLAKDGIVVVQVEENHRVIVDKLVFSEKFMRTWNSYFFYCAAGFKSRTLGCFQAVFSRPGNVAGFACDFNVS